MNGIHVASTPSAGERTRLDRTLGAVLGAALGDALGRPTEFMDRAEIAATYGPEGIRDLELTARAGGHPHALFTDDTQLAVAVARTLVDYGGRADGEDLEAMMNGLAASFVAWSKLPDLGLRAPGNACLSGCRALEAGTPWPLAGGATAGGCGSVMRAYPVGLWSSDSETIERVAVAQSRLTHNDPIALAASAAMAVGMARVLEDESPWQIAESMIATAARYSEGTAEMMRRAATEAVEGVPPTVTLDRLLGWAAHEAIAAALYVFLRHPDDPRAAVLEGANTPGDSDSIATLAGALVGGRCGLTALPRTWVRDVEESQMLLGLGAALYVAARRDGPRAL